VRRPAEFMEWKGSGTKAERAENSRW